MIGLQIILWLCATALLATYIIYPLLLPAMARLFGRPHAISAIEPNVSMVISAFNEAAVIAAKIDNALALDYPREKLEIVVISDCSNDGTDEIVQSYADRGVVLMRTPDRGGKSIGLTHFVPKCRGSIIVFSDANSMYDPAAVRNLVRHFADDNTGYAVGHQRYSVDESSDASVSENAYWNHEVRLKAAESRLSSVVGGDGAIYAIRAALFAPLREDDISDFVNPLSIVNRGYRGIFDPQAFCYEDAASDFSGEYRRKTRIVNRAVRGLFRVPGVLNPLRTGWFALQVILHKLLRWFTPYFLIGVFIPSIALVLAGGGGVYAFILAAQLGFYSLAALKLTPYGDANRYTTFAYFFCLSSIAAFVGTYTALRGQKVIVWQPER